MPAGITPIAYADKPRPDNPISRRPGGATAKIKSKQGGFRHDGLSLGDALIGLRPIGVFLDPLDDSLAPLAQFAYTSQRAFTPPAWVVN